MSTIKAVSKSGFVIERLPMTLIKGGLPLNALRLWMVGSTPQTMHIETVAYVLERDFRSVKLSDKLFWKDDNLYAPTRKNGQVVQGYLGKSMEPLREPNSRDYSMPKKHKFTGVKKS